MQQLVDAVGDRPDWAFEGPVARFGPVGTGWSARVTPLREPSRALARLHVAIVDPAGVARYTCLAATAAEAVRVAERRVRARITAA